jgi:hypothetical protein
MGDATMPGLKFDVTFMLFKGKGPSDFFVGMKPKSTLKFSKFLGDVPGVQLLDVLSLGNQALFVAIADQELASGDLPASVKNVLKPIFGTDNFTLPLTQGVTFATGVDLGKSGPIKDALSFIGAQSTTISLIGSLSPNLLDALLEGKTPTPSVSLTGNLPAFKPQLGGKIKIPTNVTFSFNASLQAGEASVGYSGGFTLPVAGDDLQMSLNTNMTFDVKNPEPEVEVSMIMADGTPWKKAFGIKWLTIEDYTMSFNVKPSELGVGFSGFTSFGSKRFGVGGDAAWGSKTAGFPIPSGLSLSVDDGPDKIGSIALKDIITVANEIIGAATGKKPLKPDLAPDVRLQGAKKGEGP